ncbi:MAG: hypothetical protein IBJ15_00345 [Alphaproteobacteria bacterium]|nr:hypothetical protein [Alphaproteobacteria bacterium]
MTSQRNGINVARMRARIARGDFNAVSVLTRLERVKAAAIEGFGANAGEIDSPRRNKQLVRVRHLCMRLCADLVDDASYPVIGYIFGGRDHTTVVGAMRRAGELLAENADLAREYAALRDRIKAEHLDVELPPSAQNMAVQLVDAILARVREGLMQAALADPETFVAKAIGSAPAAAPATPTPTHGQAPGTCPAAAGPAQFVDLRRTLDGIADRVNDGFRRRAEQAELGAAKASPHTGKRGAFVPTTTQGGMR